MDINILVQRLQHGEKYQAQSEAGDTYQVIHPPTSLMLKAAQVIVQQNNLINQTYETSQNLMRQLNDLNSQYELLYNARTTAKTSPETGPAAGN